MRRIWAAACLLTALCGSGCTGRFMWVPNGDACAPTAASSMTTSGEVTKEHASGAQLGPPCAPTCEAPPPPPRKTVFVHGPQQKIVIERECPKPKEAAKAGAPAAERQAEAVPAVANDVILVPRTVYVPYAAQTPTRAARLVSPVAAAVEQPPAAAPGPAAAPLTTKEAETKAPPAAAAAPTCPTECQPTTIIEIRQMNERIDRLHRILERLCSPGERR